MKASAKYLLDGPSKDGVGEAVDDPVDGGMQVGQIGHPQVHPDRQLVGEVPCYDHQVWKPTYPEDDHDCKHHSAHNDGLLESHPGLVTVTHVVAEVEQPRLRLPDLGENGSVTPQHHGHSNEHASDDEESVGLTSRPLPDALVTFRVEVMVAPTDEVSNLHRERHDPDQDADDAGSALGEEAMVYLVVDDV